MHLRYSSSSYFRFKLYVNLFERSISQFKHDKKPFVQLRSSVHVLEKIACSVVFNEPVLLVGETGTGKTTIVQTLAMKIHQKLTVLVSSILNSFDLLASSFLNVMSDAYAVHVSELKSAKRCCRPVRGFQTCGCTGCLYSTLSRV